MDSAKPSPKISSFNSVRSAQNALQNWTTSLRGRSLSDLNWSDYDSMVKSVRDSFDYLPETHSFRYLHPVELQDPEIGIGKPVSIRIGYSDASTGHEPVVSIGGLINTKERFDFLASDARDTLRIIAIDLAGRGDSGWMPELSDYHLGSYLEQVHQLFNHLKLSSCTLLGSSLGGSLSIEFAARYPDKVNRIILNDTGPFIPAERRARRARSVGRHYVFSSPSELFRKTTAATRNAGPTPDAALLYNQHYKTRWSDEEQGRIYRHDIRSMLAYRTLASKSLDQWEQWNGIQCPVLLIHGLESDALHTETIDQMRSNNLLSVIHVYGVGHTPNLSDGELNRRIVEWVHDDRPYPKDILYQSEYVPDRLFLRRQ